MTPTLACSPGGDSGRDVGFRQLCTLHCESPCITYATGAQLNYLPYDLNCVKTFTWLDHLLLLSFGALLQFLFLRFLKQKLFCFLVRVFFLSSLFFYLPPSFCTYCHFLGWIQNMPHLIFMTFSAPPSPPSHSLLSLYLTKGTA